MLVLMSIERCKARGSKGKSVILREKKVIADDYDESVTQIYSGFACYDENFNIGATRFAEKGIMK